MLRLEGLSERWILWGDVSGSTRFAAKVYGENNRQDDGGKLSRQFRPYSNSMLTIYSLASKLAEEQGGRLANTMGDGFFLVGPHIVGQGDPAYWVPKLQILARRLKIFADDTLALIDSSPRMKLKICLHADTVHEISDGSGIYLFGDSLNYASRVIGAAFRKEGDASPDKATEDDIVVTAAGPNGIGGIYNHIKEKGISAGGGQEVKLTIRYSANDTNASAWKFASQDWKSWLPWPSKSDACQS